MIDEVPQTLERMAHSLFKREGVGHKELATVLEVITAMGFIEIGQARLIHDVTCESCLLETIREDNNG